MTALVDREVELRELREALDSALQGRGEIALIGGEAGIGKTRLAEELAREAADRGALVVWGSCWEAGGAPAFWPWTQALRELAGHEATGEALRSLGRAAGFVSMLVPELGVPEDAAQEMSPAEARVLQFDAVAALLGRVAASQPLVVVLDDLHSADESSLLLVRFVAQRLRSMALLVVGTYRALESRVAPGGGATVADIRTATRLSLLGLGRPDVARMLEGVAGEAPADRLATLVHEVTDGNPLFVLELARSPELEVAAAGFAGATALRLTEGIRGAIGGRLELLDEAVLEVLRVAAVVGREIEVPLLRRVVGVGAVELAAALETGVGAGVLDRRGTTLAYRFHHELFRLTLYDGLPMERRLALHAKVGAAIEGEHGDHLEPHLASLAHHFGLVATTGSAEKALDYAVRAAEQEVAKHAYVEAAALYQQAIALTDLVPEAQVRERSRLLVEMGEALHGAGRRAEAEAAFLEAADAAREIDDPELLGRAAFGFGQGTFSAGVVDRRLIGLLEEALEALPEKGELRVNLLMRLAMELHYSDEADRAAALGDEAITIARALGDPIAISLALESRVMARAGPENVDERLQTADEVLELAERGGRAMGALSGRIWRICALLELARTEEARREIEAYAQLAREIGHPAHGWYASALEATIAIFAGRFDEGERRAGDAWDLGAPTREEEATQFRDVQRLMVAVARGDGKAIGVLARAFEVLAARHPAVPFFPAAAAAIELELDRPQEAGRRLRALAADRFAALPKNLSWLAALCLCAEVATTLHDRGTVETLDELLAPYEERSAVVDWAMACLGSVSRYLGLLSSALGRHDEAVDRLERAVEENARMGTRPFEARARRDLAEALLARDAPGDRDRASAILRDALETFEALGMERHRELTASSLASLGESIRGEAPRSAAEALPATFRREGEYWAVSFERHALRLKHTKGMTYLAELLRRPGEEVHALDLVAAAGGSGGTSSRAPAQEGLVGGDLGDAGVALDPQAKRAYRERLHELHEDLEEAEANNDPERAARAREEIDFIAGELSAAVGLGGRDRKAASASERARVAVTRAIRAALKRIREHSAQLADHLDTTINTGTFCSYTPDPRAPIDWRT